MNYYTVVSPFWLAVSPFWFVSISVCRRSGLLLIAVSPFWFVAVLVSLFWFVTVLTIDRGLYPNVLFYLHCSVQITEHFLKI